jgi:hypothetical protein
MNVLLVAGLCALWAALARSRGDLHEDLLRYSAATVAAALVLGTVLSPQYLSWLIPLVPLVGGQSGAAASLCFVAAAVLTRVWYPDGYFDSQDELEVAPGAILFTRNLALVAMTLDLILPAGWPIPSPPAGRGTDNPPSTAAAPDCRPA